MTGSCRFPLLFSFLPISPGKRWNARMEYLKYNASKKRERYSRCPLFLSLAVRNSGLCVCQILRFCRLLSSDFFSSCVIPEKKENACIRVSIPIFPESRKSQVTYLRLSPQICNESSFAGELSIPSMIIKFVILISLNHYISFFWCQVRKEIKCTD